MVRRIADEQTGRVSLDGCDMSIYPNNRQLLFSRLKNGICFLLAAVLFCAAGWGIFANSSGEGVLELNNEQLEADIADGLGALGVNISAAESSNAVSSENQRPFEMPTSDNVRPRNVIKDSAIQTTSNETVERGPLFPIDSFDSAPNVGSETTKKNRPATPSKRPAWLTGKIEFE
jgi:hypothetical protein